MFKHLFPALTLCCMLATNCFARTIYVSPSGSNTNDGNTWSTALATLNAALLQAAPGDQVWVARGFYRDSMLEMRDGVDVYGGFTGTETSVASRPPIALAGAQALSPSTASILTINFQDSTSVLYQRSDFSVPTVWDGFTITGGNSNENGGGVRLMRNGILRSCSVQQNLTRQSAGGVMLEYGGVVQNCYVANNIANMFGGGIYSYYGKIAGGTITTNRAMLQGGGVYSVQGTVADSVAIIHNNSQSNRPDGKGENDGGGVYAKDKDVWRNCNVSDNRAGRNGGGMYCCGGGKISGCTLRGNISGQDGGGLWCEDGAVISGSTVATNTADGHGGGAYLNGGMVLNSTIDSNVSVNGFGGGIHLRQNGNVIGCTFTGNDTHDDGGGIYFYVNGTARRCTFIRNIAQRDGGGIAYSSPATIDSCVFDSNKAERGGGVAGTDAHLADITHSTFINNRAFVRGGGFFGGANLRLCTIAGNVADGDGGGIYSDNSASKIYSCRIFNNSTPSNGGGLMLDKGGAVASCIITNNDAMIGGGVYASTNVKVANCTLARNSASQFGGGAFLTAGASLANTIVWGNNSQLYLGSNNIRVMNSAVEVAASDELVDGTDNFTLSSGNSGASNSPKFANPSSTIGVAPLSEAESARWDFRSKNYLFYNKGNNNNIPSGCNLDAFGKARIVDYTVDVGAVEYPDGFTGIGRGSAPRLANVSAYPNPVVDVVCISLPADVQGEVLLQVYNLQGLLVKRETSRGSAPVMLDLTDLPTGIFVVHIRNGERTGEAVVVKNGK